MIESTRSIAVIVPVALVAAACTAPGGTAIQIAYQYLAPSAIELTSDTQAIVVPAGMAARVPAAAALYWSRKLPILISGVPLADPLAVDDSVGMRKQLELRFGVSLTWHERAATSTEENAAYTKCILERHKINSIALVTDANHMIRARLWHEHYGLTVAPIVSNSTSWRKPLPREYIPSWRGSYRARTVVHEIGGISWFYLKKISGVRLPCPGETGVS